MGVKTMAQPEKTFRQGAVSASIFANGGVSKNGQQFEVHKVSLQRGYKDKDGQWQNTGSLGVNDIPKAVICLSKAYDFLTVKGEE